MNLILKINRKLFDIKVKYNQILTILKYNKITYYLKFFKENSVKIGFHIFYIEDKKILYTSIPKTGCSTIKSSLINNMISSNAKLTMERVHAKNNMTRIENINIFKGIIKDSYKFTFVRNPYTRILSAYLDKVKRGSYSYGNINKDISFVNFLQELDNGLLFNNSHFIPQSLFFIYKFDFIGKFENLEEDLKRIKGIEEIKTLNPHKTNSSSKLEEYYCEESISLVKKIYKIDFDLLNYSTDFKLLV